MSYEGYGEYFKAVGIDWRPFIRDLTTLWKVAAAILMGLSFPRGSFGNTSEEMTWNWKRTKEISKNKHFESHNETKKILLSYNCIFCCLFTKFSLVFDASSLPRLTKSWSTKRDSEVISGCWHRIFLNRSQKAFYSHSCKKDKWPRPMARIGKKVNFSFLTLEIMQKGCFRKNFIALEKIYLFLRWAFFVGNIDKWPRPKSYKWLRVVFSLESLRIAQEGCIDAKIAFLWQSKGIL